MTVSDDRTWLEDQLRSELRQQATLLFADNTPVPIPPVSSRPRSSWWMPLAAAVLVAALAVVTTLVVRSPHRQDPAASPTQRSTDSSTLRYPEATGLAGVAISTTAKPDIAFTNDFPPTKVLRKGATYTVTSQLNFGPVRRGQAATLVLTITGRGISLNCPPPFLVRAGHHYAITCTVVPQQSAGSVSMTLTTPSGAPAYSDVAPFAASTLSTLGPGPAGDRTVLNTTGTADASYPITPNPGRGELDAVCIGGGTISVDIPGAGGFAVSCTGIASGASLPGLGSGSKVVITGVTDQQWRVAVFAK